MNNAAKLSMMALLVALTGCEIQDIAAPSSAKDASPAAPVAQGAVQTCHAAMNPKTAAQGNRGDSTAFKCTSNCTSVPFNQIIFTQMAPTGGAPVGQIRADIYDVGPSMTQVLGCYQLGAGTNPVTVTGGDLRLLNSVYNCGQHIAINQIYTLSQNCDELEVDGATFVYDAVTAGY